MAESLPLVSVIIAVKDAAAALERTLSSIQEQSYPKIEVVVIDGGSSDQTSAVVKKYSSIVSHFVNEADQGIADAFNKGLALAKGDYINFQGAGDYFFNSRAIELVLVGVDPTKNDLVCGRVARVSRSGQVMAIVAPVAQSTALLYKMSLPHQGLLTHRRFFDRYGQFDLSCRFAMDYELLLRAYRTWPGVVIQPNIVSAWQAGGVGADKLWEVLSEYDRIKRKNQVAMPLVLTAINWLIRLRYRLANLKSS